MERAYEWKKEIPFNRRGESVETWTVKVEGRSASFEIEACYGKRLDFGSIKREWPFQREIDFAREKIRYFERDGDLVKASSCPVCSRGIQDTVRLVRICNVDYLQCKGCTHVYASVFPSPDLMERYYRENAVGDDYYLNPEEIELRLKEIYAPKARWILETYEKLFGKKPSTILDIGAGSGHFLYACKQLGMKVSGMELDRAFVAWCKQQFGIELCESNERLQGKTFDIVCSFNVIEHTADPHAFVSDYKSFMHEGSMAVLETPKVNSFTTWIQQVFPDEPRGHLMPFEHSHLFTDGSLATLLYVNGLAVRRIWYFGQDMAELILRIGSELKGESGTLLSRLFNPLQEAIDVSHHSDCMLVAATPWR